VSNGVSKQPRIALARPRSPGLVIPSVMGSSPSSGMKKPRKCRASALQAPSRASRSDLGLCGGRTSPQGPGVGPVGVQFHHRVEQLTRGRGRFIETVEVAQVLLGRRDVPRVVVVVGDLGDVLDQQPAPRRARRDDLIALLIDYPEPCCDAPRTRGTACGLGRRPEAGSAATAAASGWRRGEAPAQASRPSSARPSAPPDRTPGMPRCGTPSRAPDRRALRSPAGRRMGKAVGSSP
jgi:hypothetical protein